MLTRPAAAAVVAATLGCANVEPPPGGPPDTAPPQVLAVRPESGAVVRDLRDDAVIRFDEVIEEAGLEKYVLLSPVTGPVRVSWSRTAVHVQPKEGWKTDRVYRLELRPGLSDLRRNVLKEGRVVLFSTGPAIPRSSLTGTVVQWVEQRTATEALVRARLLPDSAAYVTTTDSAGTFRLAGVPAGRYALYAIMDANRNGIRDPREPYDSAIVTLDSTAATVLWTFVHDTAGPRLRTADHVDSLSVRLSFAQPLDPAQRLDTTRLSVVALPDSTPVAVGSLMTQAQFDSLLARERAADSARRAAADTARPAAPPQADTTRRAPVPPRAGRAPAPIVQAGTPAPSAAGDTAALRALLRQRPVPFDKLIVRVAAPLTPGAKYLVRTRGLRNLTGAAADGQAVLAVPEAPKKP